MGRSLFAAAIAALALAPPTGSGRVEPDPPDGVLVLAVARGGGGSRGVTREWAAVADPRSGALHKRRLLGGTLCHGPLLAVGGQVIFSGSRRRRPVARALPLSLRGPARSLGAADSFTPLGDRLWLGRWRGRGGHQSVALRLVDLAGRVSARAGEPLSRWSTLDAATSGGLVITHGRWLTLWDPHAQRSRSSVRDGWFVAAGASQVVWCRGHCPALRVWSGRSARALPPPAGMRPLGYGGAVSPDERQLATGVTVHGQTRLAVVDLRSGTWRLVPGGLGGYNAIAWSPSGRWLYFTDSNAGMRAWRRGARSAVGLPIRPGGTVMSIATAA